jgi:hypothetical protein
MTDETSHAKEGGPSNGPICLVSDIALPTSIIVASIVTLPHLWIYCNSFITSAFTLYSCVEIDGSKRILYPSLRNPTHISPFLVYRAPYPVCSLCWPTAVRTRLCCVCHTPLVDRPTSPAALFPPSVPPCPPTLHRRQAGRQAGWRAGRLGRCRRGWCGCGCGWRRAV